MSEAVADARSQQASRMMSLFEGYGEAYGTYDAARPNENKGGKLEIKASARTVRSRVTRDLWRQHLEGAHPLGIIPIRDNDTCVWGAIDVDVYDIPPGEVLEKLVKTGLPLVPCRTKSGGLHLYMFLSEPAPAELLRARLAEMAVLVGFGNSEIFPKQKTVDVERGALGSWLNMPYFGGDESDRCAYKKGGLMMTVGEFLAHAEASRQPLAALEQTRRRRPERDPHFGDGPPCMQHLAAEGVPEGGRNKALFAMAVFAKKKYGELRFEEAVDQFNREYFHPPLPTTEVAQILSSVRSKDYNYTCREFPLAQVCNSALCRTRKHGVGGEEEFPHISGLSVLDTTPPVWFLEVGDESIELTTEQLQTYKLFHRVAMERLHVCYRMMSNNDWLSAVSNAMRDRTMIEAPQEIGTDGKFYELLETFLTNKHRGQNVEDLLLGRPFESLETARHYFRMADLENYLDKAGFRTYSRGQMSVRVRHLGGDRHFFNIKGKGVNAWWVPSSFTPVPPGALPALDPEPI